MNKTNQVMIRMSDKEIELLDDICDIRGGGRAEMIRAAIFDYHQRITPKDYVRLQAERNSITKRKLEMLEKGKKIKTGDVKAEDHGKWVCDQLGGEIFDKNGYPYCRYKEYNDTRKPPFHEDVIENPLDEIDETTIARQFDPSREKCVEWQKWLQENGYLPKISIE